MADYDRMKVDDLKKLLKDRGLSATGNKADLLQRVLDADAAERRTADGAYDGGVIVKEQGDVTTTDAGLITQGETKPIVTTLSDDVYSGGPAVDNIITSPDVSGSQRDADDMKTVQMVHERAIADRRTLLKELQELEDRKLKAQQEYEDRQRRLKEEAANRESS